MVCATPGCTATGVLETKDFAAAQISDYLDEPGTAVWVDLCEPERTWRSSPRSSGCTPLAVEDAIQQHERPKLDRYQDHYFRTAYAVSLDPTTGRLTTSELAAFATPRALITVRKDPRFDVEGLVARWDGSADLAGHGVGFLLWGLGIVIDGHFAAVQQLDEALEGLEDLQFDARPHDAELQRRSFELRKSLVVLRRLGRPGPGRCAATARPASHHKAAEGIHDEGHGEVGDPQLVRLGR